MPSSKMGAARVNKGKHWGWQHCGSGDIELEHAEDPCAYLSRVYHPDPLAMHQHLKGVCDRLENLDP